MPPLTAQRTLSHTVAISVHDGRIPRYKTAAQLQRVPQGDLVLLEAVTTDCTQRKLRAPQQHRVHCRHAFGPAVVFRGLMPLQKDARAYHVRPVHDVRSARDYSTNELFLLFRYSK